MGHTLRRQNCLHSCSVHHIVSMEPLTSKILNDKIVSLRKEVKKAIVHQIHHISATAKQLRNKKGTEEQKKINASKADNMVSEITIFKKMKPDDVSLFGLTNFEEKELRNFLCKQIIASETKAMAKLCLRKNLRDVISQFINERSNEIDILNKLLEERYSPKENKQKKKRGKKNPKNEKRASDESAPQLVPISRSSESHSSILNQMESFDEMEVSSDSIPELVASQERAKDSHKVTSTTKDLENKDISMKKTNNSITKANTSMKNKSEVEKTDNTIVETKSERENVDPFFITRDHSEYRTYCQLDSQLRAEKEDSLSKKHNTRPNFQKRKKGNVMEYSKNNTFNRKKPQKNDYKRTISNLGNDKEKNFPKEKWKHSKKNLQDSPLNVKLHPSWEAKKKLSATSVPFQGKKITFGD